MSQHALGRSAADAQVDQWVTTYSGSVDMARLLCDRHAGTPSRRALSYVDGQGGVTELCYSELEVKSKAFAGTLRRLGVGRADRVATLLPKSPELLIATLAIWRLGAVHVPLFTAFGPDAAGYRITDSGARVVITDLGNRAKTEGLTLPTIVVGQQQGAGPEISFTCALAGDPVASNTSIVGDDTFILIYTSGTTGQPKGVQVPAKVLAEIEQYLRFGLGITDADTVWNMADPGWAYGLYYGLVGTLLLGQCALYSSGSLDPVAVHRVIDDFGVTNLTAAPTVYRLLRAAGQPSVSRSGNRLRAVSSAGEPLAAEIVQWGRDFLGCPIHDHYGQTELGMVAMNHHHGPLRRPIRPGSMGPATPGFRVVILDGDQREVRGGAAGSIAIDSRESPLFWFRSYWNAPERTAARFSRDGRYFLTGDDGRIDEDGYFHFASREDDVITSGAYRIGPYEVETSLLGHSAVAEVAVVGVPDPIKGESVKAFVVLRPNLVGNDELACELQHFVKTRLSAHQYPRTITFLSELPRTPSGKVQRYLLRCSAP